jgi:hypothetical protein
VYARKVNGQEYTFGVSGMLYRSNVLMYDRETESLWLQVKRRAVTGPLTGKKLTTLPSTVTTWKKWKKKHPDTRILSFDTGYTRNYRRDPYEDYYKSRRGMFSSFFTPGPGEEENAMVIGIEAGGKAGAWSLDTIRERGRITGELAGKGISITYNSDLDSVVVRSGDEEIPHVAVYWFVWKGMYPDSALYK